MKHALDPRRLDIAAFAKESASLAGEERLSRLPRLVEQSQGLGAEQRVQFRAEGSMQADAAGMAEPWLHLEAETRLTLICQRCLSPVEVDLQFGRDFRFVATEELAEVEDEESDEDVLVLSRSFDLLELVEDELLMDLPVAPKHAQCPSAVKLSAQDADFTEVEAEKPNPFAVLGQLKKGGLEK